jgi:hypothetical protein
MRRFKILLSTVVLAAALTMPGSANASDSIVCTAEPGHTTNLQYIGAISHGGCTRATSLEKSTDLTVCIQSGFPVNPLDTPTTWTTLACYTKHPLPGHRGVVGVVGYPCVIGQLYKARVQTTITVFDIYGNEMASDSSFGPTPLGNRTTCRA